MGPGRDLVDLIVGDIDDRFHQNLGSLRPCGIRVRVVALPGEVVDVEVVTVLDTHEITDEAEDHLLLEDLGRQAITEIHSAPVARVLVDVVHPLAEVRQPAGAALGQRDAERGELP